MKCRLMGVDPSSTGLICGQFYDPAKVAGNQVYCGRAPHDDTTKHRDLTLEFEWW